MTKILATTALAAILLGGLAAEAQAWTRSGTVTGPRGVGAVYATGTCAGGICNRTVTRTGPRGLTSTTQGSFSCAAGACTGNSTTTGPFGRVFQRQTTWTR